MRRLDERHMELSTIIYSAIESTLNVDCALCSIHQTVDFSITASADNAVQISISVRAGDPSINHSAMLTTLLMQVLY